jgi:hypothetical protein
MIFQKDNLYYIAYIIVWRIKHHNYIKNSSEKLIKTDLNQIKLYCHIYFLEAMKNFGERLINQYLQFYFLKI